MSDRHQTKPYPLRMDDGLRQLLEKSAGESGRSLNSEIVQRLVQSYVDERYRQELGHAEPPGTPTVSVVLDSRGYPQSWDEVHEHLKAIQRALKVSAIAMNTVVMSPPFVSSGDREAESQALHDYYSGIASDSAAPKPKRMVRRSTKK